MILLRIRIFYKYLFSCVFQCSERYDIFYAQMPIEEDEDDDEDEILSYQILSESLTLKVQFFEFEILITQ